MTRRCRWAAGPLLARYHDREWGVPLRDDRALFELLVLEGAQAGLAWSTVLGKRDAYRKAFARFDPRTVARFTRVDVRRLLRNPGIIRHRGKIEAAIANARAVLAVQRDRGSLAAYLWSFVGGVPRQGRGGRPPADTAASRAMSRDLRRRGFAFAGPTICYALMQAAGLVNDHARGCFRRRPLARPGAGRAARRPGR